MTPKRPSLVVIAKDQSEYIPLPAAAYDDGTVMTEWALTAEELSTLVNGGHLRLWVWTFGRPLQPVMFQVVGADGYAVAEPYEGPERRQQIERRRGGPLGSGLVSMGLLAERRWTQRRRS